MQHLKLTIKILTLLIFFAGLGSLATAQNFSEGGHYVTADLELKGAEIRGEYIVISYEIPYSGMVEIRLFDEEGDKIWQNQYADKWGENTIVLRRSKFHPGATYAFVLNYKKDEVRKELLIPPMGFE